MSSIVRLNKLAEKCAFSHEPADIVEHLEEECTELLLAIKRWKRGKGPLRDVIEEAHDVNSETNTLFKLLVEYRLTTLGEIENIREEKLDKYEAMLKSEEGSTSLINRYMNYLKDFAVKVFH